MIFMICWIPFQEKGKNSRSSTNVYDKGKYRERIQHELIRLTQHPKARTIINQVIQTNMRR